MNTLFGGDKRLYYIYLFFPNPEMSGPLRTNSEHPVAKKIWDSTREVENYEHFIVNDLVLNEVYQF